jgi:hypothetical protein
MSLPDAMSVFILKLLISTNAFIIQDEDLGRDKKSWES